MRSLLYVSISTLLDSTAAPEVSKIVEGSIAKNARWGITGALIFTGQHFAQALEGDEARIDELMGSIENDNRHRCVTIVKQELAHSRRFKTWSMAYAGEATYIGHPISRLFEPQSDGARQRDVDHILDLMDQLSENLG